MVLYKVLCLRDGSNKSTIQHTRFWVLAAHGRLNQERQSKDSRNMHGIEALRWNSAVVTNLSCLPNARQKPARKVSFFTFQQFHHVLPRLMYLRQVMCPSCCSLSFRLRPLNWIQKETKLHVQLFGLYSSPAEHSTMGHCVLHLTNLASQPTTESREQPGQQKRHVTFGL